MLRTGNSVYSFGEGTGAKVEDSVGQRLRYVQQGVGGTEGSECLRGIESCDARRKVAKFGERDGERRCQLHSKFGRREAMSGGNKWIGGNHFERRTTKDEMGRLRREYLAEVTITETLFQFKDPRSVVNYF